MNSSINPEHGKNFHNHFLKILYGNLKEGIFNLCCKKINGLKISAFSFDVSKHDEIYKKADRLKDTHEIYYEVCLQKNYALPGQRGKAETASAMPGLWFDLDIADRRSDLPTEKEAYRFIKEIPFKPSLIVHSGVGIHLYYLFRNPWVFENAGNRERAVKFIMEFQRYIIESGKKHGWKLDTTADLAGLMRFPGTYNHNKGMKNEVKMLIYDNENRYEVSDFDNV